MEKTEVLSNMTWLIYIGYSRNPATTIDCCTKKVLYENPRIPYRRPYLDKEKKHNKTFDGVIDEQILMWLLVLLSSFFIIFSAILSFIPPDYR